MEIVKKATKGFTFVELLILLSIVGILSAVIYPAFVEWRSGGEFSTMTHLKKTPEVYYVFCKDNEGVIHQTKGSNITVKDNVVVVKKRNGPDQIFANMDCWTEDATTHAEPEVRFSG